MLALGQAGVRVSTANWSRESHQRLVRWLAGRGHDQIPADLRVDFTKASLIDDECEDISAIYNRAGAYRFGMSVDQASRANVDTVRAIVTFAARLPNPRRLVHISGYRVGGQDPDSWSEKYRRGTYRGHWGL